MKIKQILLSILLSVLTIVMCSNISVLAEEKSDIQGMFLNNLNHTGTVETKGVDQFNKVAWKFKTNGRIYSSPIIVDKIAYFGSEDKNFYAVDTKTGLEIWKYKTDGAINSTCAISNNTAYFASQDGYFYAVDIKNGKLKWIYRTEGEKKADIWDYYLSSPAVYNEYVYFGSGDGNIYCLDTKNGEKVWNYKTEGIVHSSPAIAYDMVYIGSFDGNFYALDYKTGSLKWMFKTVGCVFKPGSIQGSPSISFTDGFIYFGTRDYNIYVLDAKTGKTYWNLKTPSWIIATPTIKNSVMYYGNSDGPNLFSVDVVNGDGFPQWSTPISLNIFGSCTIVDNTGYFGSLNGKLYAIDLKDGKIKWNYQTDASKANYSKVIDENDQFRYDLWNKYKAVEVYDLIQSLGSIFSTPAVSDGVIYFGSTDGYLYAIK